MPIYSFQLLSEMGVGCGVDRVQQLYTLCIYAHIRMPIYACAMRMPIFRLYACPYTVCISVVYMFTRRSSHASRRSRTRTARFAHRIARTVYNSNINVFV